MYVEKLTPPTVTQDHPLVIIAGLGQTGTNFLNTPDDRPGWASYFLDQGFIVYLSDQPARGRSLWHPSMGVVSAADTSTVQRLFTDISSHNLWPQSHLHSQWPGTGKPGDPTFDAFFSSQVQFLIDGSVTEDLNMKAYSALLDKIGTAHLITHSQAGTFGWRIGDARPDLVKGIVALEPVGPPFKNSPILPGPDRPWGITYGEIAYKPSLGPNAKEIETVTVPPKYAGYSACIMQHEPARTLFNLANIPVLVVTGEASYHAAYDYCTVEYLRQAGVKVEYANLAEEGIHGNGHMSFMEKNNLEIAQRVLKWLQKI
jgi:pimeloyl-ACP methyl ester carboxylesterase